MAGRDDGEFELILGNKQLLSVLFIVIVLLGVFFAMGFLAGRSTGGTVVTQNRNQERPPLSVEAATSKDAAEPSLPADHGSPKAEETPKLPPDNSPPAPKAEPARTESSPAAQPGKVPEPAKPPAAKPEPARKEAAKAEPVKTPPTAGPVASPPAGTYLQSAATRRADAESMLAFIGGKTGLRGYVAPSPKSPELFRVLIGPLNTNESVANARTKLAEIGIKNPYPVKY